jgi:hypothetical protein
MRMKDALALCPMQDCVLPHRSKSREWWRYGWAHGFMGRRVADAIAPVREKAYRDALSIGHAAGEKAKRELECAGVGGE